MSTEIENRIVQIQFNNKDFEKNASQTIDTLNRFEKSLQFEGAEKGFKTVEDAARKMDLSAAEASVNALTLKFSALQIAGIAAINKIVNYAMDAGGKLVKSLSLDQITGGFERYEQKLVSTRTIMNATGLSIDDVSDRIEKLMWYTDETSYSFDDMIANIAKFTSRGIDLDTSVSSIMGVANATGLAGGNAQKASHAMEGFSKALGQGYMDRQSWNWIQTAGVDIQRVTQHFMDMGVEAGTLQKDLNGVYRTLKGTIVTAGSFDMSLSDKWLTKDAMVKALEELGSYGDIIYEITKNTKMTAAEAIEYLDSLGLEISEISRLGFQASQEYKTFTDAVEATKDAVKSGWARTYEAIFGDVEEAKELWTSVGDELYSIFAEGAEYRNSMLAEWKRQGGRDAAIEGIANLYQSFKNVIVAIKDGFREMFPKMTVERLLDLTNRFKDFTAQLKLSDEALNTIKVTAKALLVPIKIAIEFLKVGSYLARTLALIMFKLANSFLTLLSSGEKVEELLRKIFGDERYERLAAAFTQIITRLSEAISLLWTRIKGFVKELKIPEHLLAGLKILADLAITLLGGLLEGLVVGLEALATLDFSKVREFFEGVYDRLPNFLKVAINGVVKLAKAIGSFFKTLATEGIPRAFSDIGNFFKDLFSQDIPDFFSFLGAAFIKVKNIIVDFISQLTLGQIVLAGFGVSILLIVTRILKFGKSISGLVDSVSGAFNSISGLAKATKQWISAHKLMALATAILMLAGALTVMALLDSQKVLTAAGAIAILGGVLITLSLATVAIDNILLEGITGKYADEKIKNLRKVIISLLGVVISIVALAAALAVVSTTDLRDIWLKLGLLAILIAAMIGITAILSKFKSGGKIKEDFKEIAIGFASFAGSLALLVRALKKMEKLNVIKVIPNMVAVSGLLIAMAKASQIMTVVVNEGSKIKKTGGLIRLALGLLAFLGVIVLISKVDIELSLGAILQYAGLLAAILGVAVFAGVVSGATNGLGKNVLAISAALLLMKVAIEQLGSIEFIQLIKGGIAALVLIAAFTAELFVVNTITGGGKAVSGARNILSIALAINLLLAAIYVLGSMRLDVVLFGTAVVSALIFMFSLVVKSSANVSKAGSSVIAISAAIGLLAIMMALMTNLPTAKAIVSTILLVSLMKSLSIVFTSMAGLKDFKWGAAIRTIVMSTAIFGLTGHMITVIAKYNWKASISSGIALAASIKALSYVMRAMNDFVDATNKLSKGKNNLSKLIKSAVTIFVLLAEVSGAVILLSHTVNSNWKQTISGAVALSVALIGLSKVMVPLMESLQMFSNGWSKDWSRITKTLVLMLFLLAEVGTTVGLLSHFSGENVAGTIASAIGMAVLIYGIGQVIDKIAKVKVDDLGEAVKTLLLMAGVLGSFEIIMIGIGNLMTYFVKNQNEVLKWGAVVTLLTGVLSPVLLAIGWVASKIANIEISDWWGAASNILKVSGYMIEIGAALVVFFGIIGWLIGILDGWTKEWGGASTIIGNAVDFIGEIGRAIGEFIGGIVGGIAGGVKKSISKADTDAMAYALETIGPLVGNLSGFGTLDQSVITGVTNFSIVLAMLRRSIESSGLEVTGTEGLRYLADDLEYLGPKLTVFSQNISDIDPNSFLLMSQAVAILSSAGLKATDYVNASGLENPLGVLAKDLVTFGKYFVLYAAYISNISNWDVIDRSALAASSLVDVANNITGTGGVLSLFNGYGEGDLADFGKKLRSFGTSLSSYAFVLSDIDSDGWIRIDTSVVYSKKLIELASNLWGPSGLTTLFVNKKDLDDFGTEIRKFGEALHDYLGEGGVGSIDNWGLIETSITAAEDLGELGTFWSNVGISYNDATNFGQVLPLIGQGIAGFYTAISQIGDTEGVDVNSLRATVDVTRDLIESISILADGESRNWSGAAVLNGLTEKIVGIVNVASKRIDDLTKTFKLMGQYGGQGYINGLTEDMTVYTNAGVLMGVAVLNGIRTALDINSPSRELYEVGQYGGEGYVNALNDSVPEAERAGQKMGLSVLEGVARANAQVGKAGQNLAEKFAKRFNSEASSNKNQNGAAQAGRALGNALVEETEVSIGTANGTPSIIMTQDGKYIVQGLANGITSEMSAEEAAKKKAENIISAFDAGIQAASGKSNIAEKEKALWEALNPDATETEKTAKEYELLSAKVPQQIERLRLAQAQLKTLSQSGYATQAQLEESYQTLLEEETAYAQLINQMLELERSVESDYNSARAEAIKAEYDLWEQTEGLTASAGQKAIKQNELYQSQLDLQAKAVLSAERAYNSAVEKFGEDTTEAYRARKTLAEANLEMWNIAKEWSQAVTGQDLEAATKDAQKNYYNLLVKYHQPLEDISALREKLKRQGFGDDKIKEEIAKLPTLWDFLKEQGFTDEDIYAKIREESGLSAADNIRNTMNESLESARAEAEEVVQSQTDNLSDELSIISAEAVELGLSQGIADGGYKGIEQGVYDMFSSVDISKIIGEALTKDLDISFATRIAAEKGSSAGSSIGSTYSSAMATNIGEELNEALNGDDGIINQVVNGIDEAVSAFNNEENPVFGGLFGLINNGINSINGWLDSTSWGTWIKEHAFNPILNALNIQTTTSTPTVEHSGMMMGRAWRVGMDSEFSLITSSVESTSTNAVDSMNAAVAEVARGYEAIGEDHQPTITPVVDMSNVERSYGDIERMFGQKTFELSVNAGTAAAMQNRQQNQNGGNNQTGGTTTVNNFTQNNYSPKALSPVEIYRQTRNLVMDT